MYENQANGLAQLAGMGQIGAAMDQQRMQITVRENLQSQIDRAKAEVERLEGVRDRMAPELLDQRIMDLRQAMQF